MTNEEVAAAISELRTRADSNTRRIGKLEIANEALVDLATSVKLLVAEQKHQTEAILDIKGDVTKLDQKVEALEQKPAKKWEGLVDKIVLTVAAAVVAFFLGKFGL